MELISRLWIQNPPPTTLLKENLADGNGLYSKLDLRTTCGLKSDNQTDNPLSSPVIEGLYPHQ